MKLLNYLQTELSSQLFQVMLFQMTTGSTQQQLAAMQIAALREILEEMERDIANEDVMPSAEVGAVFEIASVMVLSLMTEYDISEENIIGFLDEAREIRTQELV